jgi:hypothetical protein
MLWHCGLEDLEEQRVLMHCSGIGVMYQIIQGGGYGPWDAVDC